MPEENKSSLPPMPEHDNTENCPACAEVKRVIDLVNESEAVKRFKALAEYMVKEHTAIEKEFGVRLSTIYMATLENEQTDRIGISPKFIHVQGQNRDTVVKLLDDLNQQILMPQMNLDELFSQLDRVFNRAKKNEEVTFMGKPGKA